MSNWNMSVKNLCIVVFLVLLLIFPLTALKDASFTGTDEMAKEVIAEVHPDYTPWLNSLWEPPSGEVESLFFALQAAIGAGFIGYFMGYWKARGSRADKS